MKLKNLKVLNFLGIKEAEVSFGEKLTLLYGGNGEGKTSLLDAIRWALTGSAARGGSLPEQVRFGAKSAEVELVTTSTTIVRRQARSGGSERMIHGVALKAEEAAIELAKLIGAGASTVEAALRSGAILDQAPAALQKMLLALCGSNAAPESKVIAEALNDVAPAFKSLELDLPASLDAFATVQAKAEGMRQGSKRALASAEADLSRMPRPTGPAGDAAWSVRNTGGRKVLEEKLAEVEAELEKATAAVGAAEGAAAEQLRVIRARITELSSREKPKGDAEGLRSRLAGLQESIAAAGEARGSAKARLDSLESKLKALLLVAKPGTPVDAARLKVLRNDLSEAAAEVDIATKHLAEMEQLGRAARAEVKSATIGECNHQCKHHCPDLAAAEAKLKKSKEDFVLAKAALQKAADKCAEHQKALNAAEAAAAHAEAEEISKQLKALKEEAASDAKVASVTEEISKLQRLIADHESWGQAQKELETLRARVQNTAAPKIALVPPDTSGLKENVRVLRESLAAFDAFEKIAETEEKIRAAKTAVGLADAVAQACGPSGSARLKLFASSVRPFLDAANEAFAIINPGVQVCFELDGGLRFSSSLGNFGPDSLSRGQLAMFEYSLQFAVAKLGGIGLLFLDHAEVVDEAHRANLKRLVGSANKAGMQVVMATCATPPSIEPKGVPAYLVKDGTVRRLLGGAS